jgi:carboxylate-amine ligase
MTLDPACSGEAFAESTDGTVGLEEEFAILNPETLDLVPRFEELRDAAAGRDPVLAEAISGELIRSEIEIRSGRGENLHDALARQRDLRVRLFELAAAHGVALGATGTHPWADFRAQEFIDTEHYRRVVDGLQYVARRNNTFSLHAHVGIRGADRAIAVCDRLRPVLPTLLAISANSPFLDGIDAGLHSARTQAFTKSFPRCGIPDPFGNWAEFQRYLQQLVDTNSIVEFTQVWWSVRPHISYGTVEVRICDAQATAAESDALASLIVACVLQAARDHDEGRPFVDHPPRMIEENFWRAIRFGMDGRLIDLDRMEEVAAPAAAEALLEWTAPVRSELGIEPQLPALNGAQRQRRAIDAGQRMEDIYAATVQETRQTYAQEVQVR